MCSDITAIIIHKKHQRISNLEYDAYDRIALTSI